MYMYLIKRHIVLMKAIIDKEKCWQFPVVELLICFSLMSRVFNQAKEGGKKNNTAQCMASALILFLLLLLLSCLCLIKGHSVSWPH